MASANDFPLSSFATPLDSQPANDESTTEAQRLAAQIIAACVEYRGKSRYATAASPEAHVKDWPHAPVHRISEAGTYIVTAGTLDKQHWFRGAERLHLLESELLRMAKSAGWQLEAWAVFSNHYHFVAHRSSAATGLNVWLKKLHGETAHQLNRLDGAAERQVWYNYWDTQLTFEKSYFARLSYVHQNAVKHRLVPVANQYPWCSAAWFERTASPSQVRTIYNFKIDKVRVVDNFDPI
jgi:putative transposase